MKPESAAPKKKKRRVSFKIVPAEEADEEADAAAVQPTSAGDDLAPAAKSDGNDQPEKPAAGAVKPKALAVPKAKKKLAVPTAAAGMQ